MGENGQAKGVIKGESMKVRGGNLADGRDPRILYVFRANCLDKLQYVWSYKLRFEEETGQYNR